MTVDESDASGVDIRGLAGTDLGLDGIPFHVTITLCFYYWSQLHYTAETPGGGLTLQVAQ